MEVQTGMVVLTPLGSGQVTSVDMMRDLAGIRLDEQLSDGQVALVSLNQTAFTFPLLRHFPDDDRVAQYEMWASTAAVVELCTLRASVECDCRCKHCKMNPTAAWVLGGEPGWQGSVHDTTNGCNCLTRSLCDCTQVELPSISREDFIRLVAGTSIKMARP